LVTNCPISNHIHSSYVLILPSEDGRVPMRDLLEGFEDLVHAIAQVSHVL